MFKQLFEKMIEDVDIHFSVKKKNDKLTVAVFFQTTKKDKDDKVAEIKPLVATGTPDELDIQFVELLLKPMAQINEFVSNIDEVEKSVVAATKSAKKKGKTDEVKAGTAKEEKEKPVDHSAEIKTFMDNGVKFFGDRKYKDSLAEFNKAKVLDPKDKKIQAEIDKCQKWVDIMNKNPDLFGSDTPPVSEQIIKP